LSSWHEYKSEEQGGITLEVFLYSMDCLNVIILFKLAVFFMYLIVLRLAGDKKAV